jgi:hypothetical protein
LLWALAFSYWHFRLDASFWILSTAICLIEPRECREIQAYVAEGQGDQMDHQTDSKEADNHRKVNVKEIRTKVHWEKVKAKGCHQDQNKDQMVDH